MNQGYTVTPVVSEVDSGTQQIQDFNVSSHQYDAPNPEEFYVEDEYGNLEYQMPEDVDQYERVESDADQQYIDTIFEAYPQLPDALSAAADHLPENIIREYNNAIEVGDWDLVMPFIEQVIEDYQNGEFGEPSTLEEPYEEPYEEASEEEEASELDAWSDEELAAARQEIDENLFYSEPEYAHVQYWQEEADTAEDPVYRGVCAATAAFHAGEVDAEDAINYVLENYPKDDVIRIYRMITEGG